MSMGSSRMIGRRGKVGNTGTFVATETMKKPHPSLSFTRSLLFVSAINNTVSRIPTAASWHLQNSPIPSPLAQSRPQSARASEPYLRRRPQIRRPHPAKSAAPIPGRRAPAPPFPPGVLPPRLLRLRPPPAASRGITSSAGFVCARPASTRRDPRAYRPRRSPLRRLI
jgi:hypothetical protein